MKSIPKKFQTHNVKEYYYKGFKDLMSNFLINQYSTFSNLEASIAERVNKTEFNVGAIQFSGYSSLVEVGVKILNQLNTNVHSTTNLKRKEIIEKNRTNY